MQESQDRLVGVREAARRLKLHPAYLGQLCRAGKSPVPSRKRGDGPRDEWLFSDNALNEYIAAMFADQPEVEGAAEKDSDRTAGGPQREAVG